MRRWIFSASEYLVCAVSRSPPTLWRTPSRDKANPSAEVKPTARVGEQGSQRPREHAHAPVPEPLDDRPAEGVVLGLERSHVLVALVEPDALVRLDQRRVPDHVREHHRDEAAIAPLTHRLHP
jgi:hypothetical protein